MGRFEGFIDFRVSETESGMRLDHVLSDRFSHISRSKLQKHITKNEILVNGKRSRASAPLKEGDRVSGQVSDVVEEGKLQPEPLPLDILFEDEHLIVVNKPAGLSVHPGAGQKETTLAEALVFHCLQAGVLPDSWLSDPELRPGVVHRLDKDTTGALVWAKNAGAKESLARQFKEKSNHRKYLAILDGVLPAGRQILESYLCRDAANRLRFISLDCERVRRHGDVPAGYRWARSEFSSVATFAHRLTLASVVLHTGRTHQIRVHSKSIGCPVLGDQLYNRNCVLPETFSRELRKDVASLQRQMLHGETLGFRHPADGSWMEFRAPLPADFADIVGKLEPYKLS